jgi:hypothetical protein
MAAPTATRELFWVAVGPLRWRGLDVELYGGGPGAELLTDGGISEAIPAGLFAQFASAVPA